MTQEEITKTMKNIFRKIIRVFFTKNSNKNAQCYMVEIACDVFNDAKEITKTTLYEGDNLGTAMNIYYAKKREMRDAGQVEVQRESYRGEYSHVDGAAFIGLTAFYYMKNYDDNHGYMALKLSSVSRCEADNFRSTKDW